MITGEVKNGKFIPYSKEAFINAFQRYEGKKVKVEVKKLTKQRSMSQNRYYWGIVLNVFGDYLGYEPEEMHEICKSKFLKDFKMIGDIEVEYVKSTTNLSTADFEQYMEKIRTWASKEFACYIPDPNSI